MRHYIFLTFLFLSFTSIGQYNIDIKLDNYESDTLIVGNYYADKQLVHDTLIATEKGRFLMSGTDTLNLGVYFLLTVPSNGHVQFFVNGKDNDFEINWDVDNTADLKIKGSEDNEKFLEYVRFLSEKRPLAERLNKRLALADSIGVKDIEAEEELDKVDKDVKSYQNKLISNFPEMIASKFVSASKSPDMPEFGDGPENQYAKYQYLKKHYFDNIDLGDPVNLRTPYYHGRIDYYIKNLTPQDPDSIILSVDYLLNKMKPSADTYKYYLSHFLNKYAALKIIGFDKVYVHLVDNYYSKGEADWIKEETLLKMQEQANNLRNILIGEKFPDITTYKKDSTAVRIWDIDSPYTLVLFWAHDCGHCTKSMPDIVSFYEEYESKGVTLISICTKGGKKMIPCQEAVPKKNMENFINTFDQYQRYRKKVHIRSTPKIFILDKDKKILIKDLPSKELKNIMPEIIKMNTPEGKS